jgi:enterochelin esterase-like enzyme
VLYLLHGLTYDDSQWDMLGVDEAADTLIRSGRIPPRLIVMPSERTGLDHELAIVEGLIPFVDSKYRTADDKSGRAIGGLSRGGGWALRIGFKHPELFSAVGLHSPAVLPPDLYDLPTWIATLPLAERPRLWIDAGDRDPLKPSILELVGTLESAGYDFTWSLMPGDHSAVYWTAHVQDYLKWYAGDG